MKKSKKFNLLETQIKNCVKISNFSNSNVLEKFEIFTQFFIWVSKRLNIWLLKNIIFNFKTKLTIKDQIARINITLPTKTRPINNHEFFIKI
jgi:hypothetical protein